MPADAGFSHHASYRDVQVDVVRARSILVVSSLALLAAPAARAEGLEIVARYGPDGGEIEGGGLALRLGTAWSKDWGNWKFDLRPELELNHFRHTGSASVSGAGNLNELGASAMLRLHRGNGRFGPYAEIGLGAAAISRVSLGNKDFSTGFQFTERVGLGLEFGGGWFAGWQYSHYSNASIKTPNDGMDFHMLVIGVRF